MAQILVRNLDDRLKTRLQRRAKRNGHSMEAEVREILRDALKAEDAQKVGFGTASVALFSGSGVYLDGPIEEIHPGDVVWFAPNEKHWHGATATTGMTHIAVQEKLDGKVVDWMEHVSDAQYLAG